MLVHNPFYDLATSNLYMARNWRHALDHNNMLLDQISLKDVFRKFICSVSVCCIYLIIDNNPTHRDLFQFVEILRQYSNFKLRNWL